MSWNAWPNSLPQDMATPGQHMSAEGVRSAHCHLDNQQYHSSLSAAHLLPIVPLRSLTGSLMLLEEGKAAVARHRARLRDAAGS